jgi:exopolysaccharide production protein ExoZ
MKLNSIQFLRAVAVTLVVYAHSIDLTMQFGKSRQQDFYYLNNIGCIGVDLFFVISGFIITYVARNYSGTDQGLKFLQKRFYRINPIYYIASGLFIAVLIARLGGINSLYAVKLKLNLVPSIIDTLWIIPTSGSSLPTPLLLIGWTLSFEWLFYILHSYHYPVDCRRLFK